MKYSENYNFYESYVNYSNKVWVLVHFNSGRIEAWRDYGDVAWGSPIYSVIGYFEGTYRQALKTAKQLISQEDQQ